MSGVVPGTDGRRPDMVATENIYPRRRASGRTWLAFAAAAVAVLVLIVLVAVACNARSSRAPGGLDGSPVPAAIDDDELDDGASPTPTADPGDADGGDGGDGDDGDGDDGDGGDGDDGDGDDGDGDDGGGGPGPGGPAALAGYELVTKSVSVVGFGFLRDTVLCPAGKVALGGGAQVTGAGSSEFQVAIQESVVGTIGGGAQSLWLVALRNQGFATRTIGLRVACALPPAGYEVVGVNVPLPAGGFAREPAVCPAGKVVLGGGASVVGAGSQNFHTGLRESTAGEVGSPAQALWLVSASNFSGQDRTLGIRAVCADPVAGYQITFTDVAVAVGDYAREGTRCPAGTVVLAGGASVVGAGNANFGTTLRESMPGEAGSPPVPLWLVSISNDGTADRDIRMRAVCATAG
jgi:hypothetical protein